MPAVPAGVARWREQLTHLLTEVHGLVDPLNQSALDWRPAPGRWSIAECVDHLSVTGGGLLHQARPALEAARARGLSGAPSFDPGWLGRWFVKQVGPDSGRAVSTQSVFMPRPGLPKAQLLQRFDAMQHGVLELVDQTASIPAARVKVRSAATPLLRLNLAAWIEATIAHERRHLAQARDVAGHPEFPEPVR